LSDLYAVLGILPGATPDEIKQAYVRLAKTYHPDKNRSPGATERMAEINLAYETLRDGDRRKEYDRQNTKAELVEEFAGQYEEDEEIGQEDQQWSPGKCVRCNFVNNSGMFVCSVCGYVFDPHAASKKGSFDELDDPEEEDALAEIIRCPRCNEINKYSSGSCWQCGLDFEIEEIA
jgi:curved DNA-binding protein CbpA